VAAAGEVKDTPKRRGRDKQIKLVDLVAHAVDGVSDPGPRGSRGVGPGSGGWLGDIELLHCRRWRQVVVAYVC